MREIDQHEEIKNEFSEEVRTCGMMFGLESKLIRISEINFFSTSKIFESKFLKLRKKTSKNSEVKIRELRLILQAKKKPTIINFNVKLSVPF